MTINNLYKKLSQDVVEPLQISSGLGKDAGDMVIPKAQETFDKLDESESMAKL